MERVIPIHVEGRREYQHLYQDDGLQLYQQTQLEHHHQQQQQQEEIQILREEQKRLIPSLPEDLEENMPEELKQFIMGEVSAAYKTMAESEATSKQGQKITTLSDQGKHDEILTQGLSEHKSGLPQEGKNDDELEQHSKQHTSDRHAGTTSSPRLDFGNASYREYVWEGDDSGEKKEGPRPKPKKETMKFGRRWREGGEKKEVKGCSNWILHQKRKYSVCCLRDVILKIENSI